MRASCLVMDKGVRVTHMLHVNSFLKLHHHIIDSRLEERPPGKESALLYLIRLAFIWTHVSGRSSLCGV